LTGRTNNRDCIDTALPCDNEDPAPTCSMGRYGGLPHTEFTFAKAAKKSKLGDYATIHLGKWHLGDLWDKRLPGMSPEKFSVSNPGHAGFDEWLTTQAEASNSDQNCGCFPVEHKNPDFKPPSGYDDITPNGSSCVVGGGYESDWCYPCTNYYYPNASDPKNVSALNYRVQGDDSEFIVNHFETFLNKRDRDERPWLAHLCFHAIHEPHPALPEYYNSYKYDQDYIGALTQWDVQVGRLMSLLKEHNAYENTLILYSADNGPHQGKERTDIRYSTRSLRQCKVCVFLSLSYTHAHTHTHTHTPQASMWEGGIRVPGAIFYPPLISRNLNITMPTTSTDVLPTIMNVLQVEESDNPSWTVDGLDLIPTIEFALRNLTISREKPIGFDSTGGQHALIDNKWKLLHNPGKGQCDFQPPYNSTNQTDLRDRYMLFDLDLDPHELHDISSENPDQYETMMESLFSFLLSVRNSQVNETGCAAYHDELRTVLSDYQVSDGTLPRWAYD